MAVEFRTIIILIPKKETNVIAYNNNATSCVPLFISNTTVQLSCHLNWNYETMNFVKATERTISQQTGKLITIRLLIF